MLPNIKLPTSKPRPKQNLMRQHRRNTANQLVAQAIPQPRRSQQIEHLNSQSFDQNLRVQSTVDDLIEISDYKSIANAVLNPGHEGNTMAATPFPDGTATEATFVHKNIVLGSITIPAGSAVTQFQIALVPFAEYPMLIRFNGEQWSPVADTKFTTPNGSIDLPCNYFHRMGVYAHRLIGKSVTLTNETSEMYKSGNITCCRMPSLVDNNAPETSNLTALTAPYNQRVIQTMPTATGEMSMNLNATNWHAKEGAYLITKPSMKWIERVFPWDKATSNYLGASPAPLAANTADALFVGNMTGSSTYVQSRGVGYGTDGDYTPAMAGNFTTPTSTHDGSDVVTCIVDGLQNAGGQTFKFKLCIVREFGVKNTSPLIQMVVPRPLRSDAFVEALMNYSTQMSGMYPARYNFFNELWTGFKKVLRKISDNLPGIGKLISPVLPPEARIALDIANRVNDTGRQIFGL